MSDRKKSYPIEVKVIRVDANHCGGYRFGQEYYACLAGYRAVKPGSAGLLPASEAAGKFSEDDYLQVSAREVFEKRLPLVIQQYLAYGIKASWLVKRDQLTACPSYDEFTIIY